jgi:2,4-dienoyl-CoA reductase-like NADH-dependent reductase (Old Yellow Enzyme family)/thioredoxin reductase
VSNKPEFEKLLQPSKIGRMDLANRLVMSPMGNNFGSEDGDVTERQIAYYAERANGGPGLIITEMVSIDSPLGQRGAHQLRIDEDRYIKGLNQLTREIHQAGRKIAIQLCHAGLLAASAKVPLQPVAPSPVKYFGQTVTGEMSYGEIEEVIAHFVNAARRAVEAGFDSVEIHAAHSYLLAHFLSPVFNRRSDEFGGNTENRARILLEIIGRTRQALGTNFPVWCRMNGAEYGIENGLTIDEAKKIALMAEKTGCAAIHVSAGGYGSYYGYNRACMGQPKGNLSDLAAEIKKAVQIPVIAVGRIDLLQGETLIREAKADFIAIGRAQIADPHLVRKAFTGRLADIRPCIGCNVCVDDLTMLDVSLHCTVNACVGKERESKITRSQNVKKVLIIGGGPAGMEAAIVATRRGHEVTIWEKQPQLGGKLLLAAAPPHKAEIRPFTEYLVNQIKKLGVKVELGKTADLNSVQLFKPDAVVIAAGATPLVPPIPGVDSAKVVFAEDVLAGKAVGRKVVIIGGGMVGCETAEFLVVTGKKVTIVEMLSEIATGVGSSLKMGLISRLTTGKVTVLTGTKCKEITEKTVIVTGKDGKDIALAADTVVLAVGAQPDIGLFQSLKDFIPEIEYIGDCVQPRRIIDAVGDGYRVGLSI